MRVLMLELLGGSWYSGEWEALVPLGSNFVFKPMGCDLVKFGGAETGPGDIRLVRLPGSKPGRLSFPVTGTGVVLDKINEGMVEPAAVAGALHTRPEMVRVTLNSQI